MSTSQTLVLVFDAFTFSGLAIITALIRWKMKDGFSRALAGLFLGLCLEIVFAGAGTVALLYPSLFLAAKASGRILELGAVVRFLYYLLRNGNMDHAATALRSGERSVDEWEERIRRICREVRDEPRDAGGG